MPDDQRLRKVLESVARRMLTEFEASGVIQHNGAKGTVREDVLRDVLERYLTRNVSVLGSSEIVSAGGDASGQCDISIVDPVTPPLYDEAGHRVLPIECVDAVIEVKSNLTVEELRSAWKSIRRVKTLLPTALLPQRGPIVHTTTAYGRTWDYRPVSGFIFAYEGATLETLGSTLAELHASEPDVALGIDSVFVLKRGSLMWSVPGGTFSGLGHPQGAIVAAEADPASVLMAMVLVLNKELATVKHRMVDLGAYIPGSVGEIVSHWIPRPLP